MNVLVLGGNGFIGSAIVNALYKLNSNVLIGTRKRAQGSHVRTVHMQNMAIINDWSEMLKDVDVVVNTVGILRERKNETYEQVHQIGVMSLANACQKLETKLIHISVIGLRQEAKSRFLTTKLAGENAILVSGADAIIVRPSLLDGEGGYGAKWFRRVSAWPIQLVMQSEGLIAPLQVKDLGEAVAALCQMGFNDLPKVIELGGSDILTIPQYLKKLRNKASFPAWQLAVPKVLVRVVSHLLDLFNWTPLSFGHYELMQGYNVPANNWLPKLLGRAPTAVGRLATSDGVDRAWVKT
jgi:NADH dehydrogenase